MFGSQRARDCLPSKSGGACQGTVNGQLAELRDAVTAAKRRQPDRKLDLVLLSVGANDIYFSGLVADVIVDTTTERALFRRSGVMASVDDARSAMTRDLPQGFAKLREALKPLVGGDLSRVVYTSYANPTLSGGGAPCPGGRAGFDIHPSFNAQPQRLAAVSNFVENEFLPQLKALALCQGGILCRNPRADRMTFVDDHQTSFAGHGFCARAESDPEFDRQCFSASGDSFDPDIVTAASQPMLCGRSAGEYRAYLPRARWIRDANDSYFAAMTYPQGLPSSQQPSDIHDATWGILSAVYGGAVHPSAEGHAAMADAAVPAAAAVLQLDAAVPEVTSQPVPPIPIAPAYRGHRQNRRTELASWCCRCWRRCGNGGLLCRGRGLRTGGRLHRSGLRRQIFCDDGGIDLRHRRIRQTGPDLILAEQRDAEIAAHRQRLSVGTERHLGLVDLAVARIEHVAVLVFQAVALHVADEGEAEPRRILAIVGAFRADRIGRIARLEKKLGERAFEDAVVIDHQKPSDRLALLELLPQPGRRRLRGLRGKLGGKREPDHDRQYQSKSG